MKCQIEVTNYCNFNCHGCLRNKMKRPLGFMSVDTFALSLWLCEKLGVKEVWLHNWGEPLLHPNIINMVKTASTTFDVGFTTNGYYLNKLIIDNLANAGLKYLDISVNASTPKDLLPHIYELFGSNPRIDMSIRCVVFSENEYKDMYDIFHKKYFLGLNKVKWQRGMINQPDVCRTSMCSMIDKLFIIQWDGTVVPCCETADNEVIYVEHLTEDLFPNWILDSISAMHRIMPAYCKTCKEVDCDIPVTYKLKDNYES